MYDMNFKVDFNANTLEVTGHQSKFPAYEVVHGRSKVGAEKCYIHWGVAGENVWSLMDDALALKRTKVVNAPLMDLACVCVCV